MDGPLAVATRRKHARPRRRRPHAGAGYHFPFPACGHIVKTATGYEHVPVLWNIAVASATSSTIWRRRRPARKPACRRAGRAVHRHQEFVVDHHRARRRSAPARRADADADQLPMAPAIAGLFSTVANCITMAESPVICTSTLSPLALV